MLVKRLANKKRPSYIATMPAKSQPQRKLFRVSIIYSGKYSGKVGNCFLIAKDIETAENAVRNTVSDVLKKSGQEVEFKLNTTLSSQEEVMLYAKNRLQKNYSGAVN